MGLHDQLFKELLEAFLGDFLHLTVPGIARRLRLEEPRFLPRESFTDLPQGERRELDLVARVPSREEKPEVVLVHVEVEARARRAMGRRLWEYSRLLKLRHKLPVLPIVLYLEGGEAGVVKEAVVEQLFGEELALFHYFAFGLARSRSEPYLGRGEPLAWALAALMRPPGGGAGRLKLECLRRIQRAELDEARRYLLVNCVETYLQLEGEEAERYQSLLDRDPDRREVTTMERTWAEKLESKGLQRGLQEGMRSMLLEQLEERFGSLSPEVRRRVAAIESTEELTRLARRVLSARSPEEMGLA